MDSTDNRSGQQGPGSIAGDRPRTNLFWKVEEKLIYFLVRRIPSWYSSDMLTATGFLGNVLVCLAFLLASFFSRYFLLLGLFGFMVSWFGDSLDGRIAYFRKKPRKWYGYALDITIDWLGILLIGLGFITYAGSPWAYLGYGFVVLYGWAIISSVMRYKITGKVSIDSGIFGPTEVRFVLCLAIILETLISGSIIWAAALANLVLFIVNSIDFGKLLKQSNARDAAEKKQSQENV